MITVATMKEDDEPIAIIKAEVVKGRVHVIVEEVALIGRNYTPIGCTQLIPGQNSLVFETRRSPLSFFNRIWRKASPR